MVGAEAVFLGSLSTATWAFLEAAALDPTSAFFLSQAGFALNAGGRYADARPLLLAARAADEAFYPAHLNLGAAYEGLEDWWRAIGELQMVVYLQPRNWTFLAWLARLYAQVGMTAVARGLLESAVEMAPDDPDLQAELDALPPDDGPPPGDPLSPTVSQPSDASGLVAWAAMVQCVPTVFGADMQSWIEAGIRYEAAEGEVEDAFHDENWEQLVCEGQCPEWPLEAEHACEQQCRVANCSAHQASLASGLPPMFGENAAEQAACTRVQNDHLACLMSAFGRIGDTLSATATQFFLEYVDTAMADWAHTCQGEIPATLREEVAALSQDVAMTCDNAATPFDAVDADDALSQSDRFTNVELCLDGLVCVDLADGGITIEVEGELLAGEVTLDFDTGDFGFGFGLGVSDPTGLFQASVLLKFHTARGIGISGEARAGGPLSAKLGVDFWAFTN
jgi:tetratricopeptide (TPR) repeat protein